MNMSAKSHRPVFAGMEQGHPVAETPEGELCRLRDTLRSLLTSVHDHGEGAWSRSEYDQHRKNIQALSSTNAVCAKASELLRPHGWSDEELSYVGLRVMPMDTQCL